ncbi:unnamed protein product [Orchesella dallaii]|uniref:Uncharacterized protein n=1 Tax=Orchesella dallaii TaxID=48710 RepID=A0ABP1RQ03_9HEXA
MSQILLLSIYIFLPLKSVASFIPETLNLSPQLELFRDCSVQLVLNHVALHQERFNFSKSHNIAPLSFPIVLLSVKYKPLSFIDILTGGKVDTNCDKAAMTLLPNQGPKFRRIPEQRHKCFVQVYVDPLPCHHWTTNDFDYERPTGISDLVMDRRLSSQWPPSSIGNRMMIHVTKVSEASKNNAELLHTVGRIWAPRNNIISTKLLFLISYSGAHKQFIVNETSILTCKDCTTTIQTIEKKCVNPDFIAAYTCKTLQALHLSSNVLANRIVYTEKTIQSRSELDTAVYQSVHCQNLIWLALLPIKSYSPKSKTGSTYVTELRSKEGEENLNAKAVLFGILFPNATILGFKYDEYLFSVGYAFWKQPSIHPHDRQFPVMDTISYSSDLKSVHFITCAPPQNSGWLSLAHLFSSFTYPVWILLILASVLTGVFAWANHEIRCKLYLSQRDDRSTGVWLAVDHVVFVWRILVQQSYYRSPMYWCICSVWLLMATVLTIEYLGGNITNISAPIETRNIESFEELFNSNFTIYSPVNNNERMSITSKFFKDAGNLGHLFYNTFSGVFEATNDWDHDSIFSKLLRKNGIRYNYSDEFIQKILNEKEATFSWKTVDDIESSVSEDKIVGMISKCRMEAYVDTYENIQRLKLRLVKEFPHHIIAMSKQPFDEMYENWEVRHVPIPVNILLRRSHSLFQSGLVHWWNSWAFRVNSWNVTVGAARDTEFQAVSLQGNIQALFYLYLGMIGIATIMFSIEMGKIFCAFLKSNGPSCFQVAKNVVREWLLLIQMNCFNRTVTLNS